MDLSNKKKNLIAGIGSVFVIGALGVAISFVIFGDSDAPHVQKPTPFTQQVETQQVETQQVETQQVGVSLEDEPQILELTMLPLNHEASEILKYSKQLSIETVRAKALLEQSKGDKLAGKNQAVVMPSSMSMPVMLPELNGDYDQSDAGGYGGQSDTPSIPISEQIVINGIMRVGDIQSGIVGFGSEVVPVRVGSKFGGVKVIRITDNSITFTEKSKNYTRYLGKQAVTVKRAKA